MRPVTGMPARQTFLHFATVIFVTSVLYGCGGGGGDDDPPPAPPAQTNDTPQVNAGAVHTSGSVLTGGVEYVLGSANGAVVNATTLSSSGTPVPAMS